MDSLLRDTSGVVTRVLGHTIVPDLAADRSGSCSMFDKMTNIATKALSRDDGLVARLAILSTIWYRGGCQSTRWGSPVSPWLNNGEGGKGIQLGGGKMVTTMGSEEYIYQKLGGKSNTKLDSFRHGSNWGGGVGQTGNPSY